MSHSRTVGRLLALVSLIALLTFTMNAFGQGVQGSIAGTVRDASGAVIPGARVTLTNQGTNTVLTTTTSGEGSYVFTLINNGKYTVTVEKQGFQKATYRDVEVLPAQQYSLAVMMQVGAESQTVEVQAGQDLVNTTSSEVTGSVDQKQVLNLPLLGRNPIELIRTQAGTPGILAATRNTTTINGGRPGWTQTTQDGININDNFIRNNANDFVQNRPTSDTIAEFSIVTNTPGADSVGGTSQVRLVTPAGTNAFHGSVYDYNRNSALASNSFFNKRTNPPLPKNQLNLNQFGGRIGGPVLKDKLFFFGSYEGYRLRQQISNSNIVPINNNYLQGVFNITQLQNGYGTPKVNVPINILNMINSVYAVPGRYSQATLPTQNLAINPEIQKTFLSRVKGASLANSNNCGDSINTTCDVFKQTNPQNRDQEVARIDYNLNQKHSFEFVAQRYTDWAARTDFDNIDPVTKGNLATNVKMFVGAWRYMISPTLVNEVRIGDNTSIVPFKTGRAQDPTYFLDPGSANNNAPTLTGLGVTSPDFYFMPQGRTVTTRQYMDNATWTKGKHNIAFGGSFNRIAPHTYNYAGLSPTVIMGFASATVNNAYNLTAKDFRNAGYVVDGDKDAQGNTIRNGFTANTIAAINNYAAFLSGTMTQMSQTFNVKNIGSGYVAGYPNARRYSYSIWSPYVQDSWKVKSNLTVNAGLKWEYWTPLTEGDGLGLLPVIPSGKGITLKGAMLDPNAKVGPASTFWKPDYMQLAPNFGFAWDPFKNGKTSIRGGWSLSFVNEDMVTAANNALVGNPGLTGSVTQINLTSQLTGAPQIAPPTFTPNRSYLDQLNNYGVSTAAYAIDPHLKTPYAHQFNLEIQREVKWDTAIYARYVGTFGRDLWRGVDYNQQMSGSNADYVADFVRARSNYFACGGNPYGTGTCGQALQWIPQHLEAQGMLTYSSALTYIATGRPGTLADFWVTNRSTFTSAPNLFLPNPNIYALDALINGAHSNYNALQIEARRPMKNGLGFQVNYTWSKLLSDAAGNSQSRFEPLLDNARPNLDYGRSEYDLNHVINSNFIYELPFGRGKRFLGGAAGAVDRVIGGWSVSSIVRWQGGNPFSILSGYGTYNRTSRSTGNTAYSTLSKSQIKNLLGFYNVNGKLYWINPSVINPVNGYGVGTDGPTYTPTYTGQVFYNPESGQTGNFQKLSFNGPGAFDWDFSVAKKTRLTERINTEFRADFFNFTNSAQWWVADYNINSSTFGRITSTTVSPRIAQLSLRVNF